MSKRINLRVSIMAVLFALLLTGCAQAAGQASSTDPLNAGKINVVATTTIVADVVRNVGGEHIALTTLIPPGTDEHGYQPAPQDVVRVTKASLVFMNGAGLEQFIQPLMKNAAKPAQLVSVSDGITLLEGPAHPEETGSESEANGAGDPHVWTDPNNVLVWVDNIEKALKAVDPRHSADYEKNAGRYRQQLRELDGWVREQVNQVPPERRKLVTDHLVFTYFANRYGFEQVGAVVPGYSTMTAPSAQELAALEKDIQKLGVPAIFVGNTVNPSLTERVTQDTHTKLVSVLTGSLSEQNGPGATYLAYMKYNVEAICGALK
jgi:ABC-type Zn uptake system ZnuABC Zn-binding protein ZnuA